MKSTAWFLAIYSAVCLFLFFLTFQMTKSYPNSSGSINSGFFFAGAIFLFVSVSAGYKPHFNFLLMFGNTRRNISLSSVCTFSILSVVLAVISLIAQLLDKAATVVLAGNSRRIYQDLLSTIYKNNVNAATEFLWFLGLFLLIFSVAMLYGSLSYKFGKAFITCFWIAFGLSWMVLPAMAGAAAFINALKAYFCYGVPNGILLAPVNFLITAIILCAGTYALSARQPQVA
jgi:hypothetical protein